MGMNRFLDLGTIDAAEAGDPVSVATVKAGNANVTVTASTSPAWDGTAVVEISHNDVDFVEAPTTTGNDPSQADTSFCYIVPCSCSQVRVRCSEHTAGSVSAYLGAWID